LGIEYRDQVTVDAAHAIAKYDVGGRTSRG
jgi:hypothetical protein